MYSVVQYVVTYSIVLMKRGFLLCDFVNILIVCYIASILHGVFNMTVAVVGLACVCDQSHLCLD